MVVSASGATAAISVDTTPSTYVARTDENCVPSQLNTATSHRSLHCRIRQVVWRPRRHVDALAPRIGVLAPEPPSAELDDPEARQLLGPVGGKATRCRARERLRALHQAALRFDPVPGAGVARFRRTAWFRRAGWTGRRQRWNVDLAI